MCGIVGAVLSEGSVLEGLVDGLRVLEYRGYDSSGIAVACDGSVQVRKKEGRLARLEEELRTSPMDPALVGIGHTRWATHGPPSDRNAHPHMGGGRDLAVVHNGVIENHHALKAELLQEGVVFSSETDTEVLAHLLERELRREVDPITAVRAMLQQVEGYYALAVLFSRAGEETLVCARQGPPLAIAATEGAAFLASDLLALLPHTNRVSFLEDGDLAILSPGEVQVFGADGEPVERIVRSVTWEQGDSGLGQWPHHMLKEIHEQPDVLARTAFGLIDLDRGDVQFSGSAFSDERLSDIDRVQVLGCGTALHAGLIASYLIEGIARIPVDVDFASEYRYRQPILGPGTMALAVTQSGETADTLAASRLAQDSGGSLVSICNSHGSSQVRASNGVILTQAGPEIGVASTKAFTAQVTAAFLLAVRMGRARGVLSPEQGRVLLDELRLLRPKLDSMLTDAYVARVRRVARMHVEQDGFLFLGRGVNYPVALEGALKLKEISYMHAEGYAAGEMKHGPIALIDPGMTIVVINSIGLVAEKVRANIEQVKARGGVTVSVGSDQASHEIADEFLPVPECCEWLSPVLNTIPLQLLAYYIADLRGCDIDKPRNLAKSVTVE